MPAESEAATDVSHALKRSQERLQSILDSAYNAYVAIDDHGLVIDWNRQAVATFGYARDEAIGRAVAELIIPTRYCGAHWSGLARFLATGEGPVLNQRLELEARHHDGHEFPIEITIWPLRVDDGWTFHAFVCDATELRAARSQALATERQAATGHVIALLTQASSGALQQLQTWTEVLALEAPPSSQAFRAIAEIQAARTRIERLFLDVRGYAAPLQLTPREVDLAELWRDAWQQVAHFHRSTTVQLTEETRGVAVRCVVDPNAFGQALYHVLENAHRRAGVDGQVGIVCRDDQLRNRPALCLAVRDTGPPLSREERRSIESQQSEAHLPGTFEVDVQRLGVAITVRIVVAHGGRLAPGGEDWRGGEVRILLPRVH